MRSDFRRLFYQPNSVSVVTSWNFLGTEFARLEIASVDYVALSLLFKCIGQNHLDAFRTIQLAFEVGLSRIAFEAAVEAQIVGVAVGSGVFTTRAFEFAGTNASIEETQTTTSVGTRRVTHGCYME